jgi:hypothetical protein
VFIGRQYLMPQRHVITREVINSESVPCSSLYCVLRSPPLN